MVRELLSLSLSVSLCDLQSHRMIVKDQEDRLRGDRSYGYVTETVGK